ncbi:hypothetical protein F5883DRAFT_653465 [Diaporthe sp. PMI_573]|nr:hypothetical protein F5883DRAFT_653465 [Diaporthaceae sp. PMI_573]
MTRPLTNVGAVNHEMVKDFNKRLYSIELIVNNVLGLLQQKSEPPPRDSPEAASPDPIISRLDGLFKSVIQLKEDLERSSNFVCPECGHYLLEHPTIQQLERQPSLHGGNRGRPSTVQRTENVLIVHPDHQPDGLELTGNPGVLAHDTSLEDVEDVADNAVFANDCYQRRVSDSSRDAAEGESMADDDESVAVETGSQQDTDIILEEHDL